MLKPKIKLLPSLDMVTFSSTIENKNVFKSYFLLVSIVCCGPLCVGELIGYSSSATVALSKEKILNSEQVALFASLFNIGGILGCSCVSRCLEKFGRRWVLAFSLLPAVLGAVCIGTTSAMLSRIKNPSNHWLSLHVMLLMLGRILGGLTCGLNMVATSVYLVELAPTHLRGMLGSCNQLGIVLGILISLCAGQALHWSTQSYLCVAPIFVLLVSLPFMLPESPRYLIRKGRRAEAVSTLRSLRSPFHNVEEEVHELEEALDREHSLSLYETLCCRELRSPLRTSFGLFILQQLSGINAVLFFTDHIFISAGYSGGASFPVISVGAVQVIFTIFSVVTLDRFGRRQLIQVSGVCMTVALLALALFFSFKKENASPQGGAEVVHAGGLPALLALLLYIMGFSLGWGPAPSLVSTEVMPLRARTVVVGAGTALSFLTSFLVTEIFGLLVALPSGPAISFALFCLCTFLGIFFVSLHVPETKGKSLEEIELFFMGQHFATRSL